MQSLVSERIGLALDDCHSIHMWSSAPRIASWGIFSRPFGLIAVDNPTQDYPGFPVRGSGHICVCGFLYGKPHQAQ